MAALRVLPPEHYVGAVESIPLVVDLVAAARGPGAVYRVDDDLYFSVTADDAFGGVVGLGPRADAGALRRARRDPERPGKKDPLDCVLWRAERPGEPAWDARWGGPARLAHRVHRDRAGPPRYDDRRPGWR